jgi:hypothetical protein
MNKCLYCGNALPDNSAYCNYCGATQKSSHIKEPQKSPSSCWIIIAILLVIGGVILVPIIAPDLANEKPGDLLLYGGSLIVIGIIAWLLEWSGKIRLVGSASCCLVFPIIGLFIFLFGLYSFFVRPSSSQVETCTIRLSGYETYIILNGKGAKSLCDYAISNHSSTFQRSSYSPQSPIICRETIDNVEYVVVDTSTLGIGGNLACKSLYETMQK